MLKELRSESWQIATFNNEHTCPPRRDNKHVTARRIAEKYEKFIISNPSWNFAQMKSTVVRIDGPRVGVNWAFFKILKQIKQP